MKKFKILILCALATITSGHAQSDFLPKQEIGIPYRGWKPGEIDIHHIYTGRGESSFFILPDGTSLLIDVGDWDPASDEYPLMTPQLPDSSMRAGQRIACYVKSFNPKKDTIDYLLVSHFHSDHIGDAKKGSGMTVNRTPNYQLSGIAEFAEYIKINKIIDRGYPDYNFPLALRKDPDFVNYANFIQWKVASENLSVEQFQVGSNRQITLKRGEDYPDFEIKNLFNSGVIWNDSDKTMDTIYHHAYQKNQSGWNENTMSNGFKLSYGHFTYYTGGDLSGYVLDKDGEYIDIEGLAAKYCGPVDVAKANHHAYKDALTPGFIKYINASAIIVPVWDKAHIQPEILHRIRQVSLDNDVEVPHLIFTHFPHDLKIDYSDEPWMKSVLADGHVVIKVFEEGRKYRIYILDAHSDKKLVKAVYGPYVAKGGISP